MAPPLIRDPGNHYTRINPETVVMALQATTARTETPSPGLAAAMRVNSILQTTLDIHTVIRLFANELSDLVDYDGLQYRNPAYSLEINHGKNARHSCSYRLVVHEEALGELTLSRRRKFTDAEMHLCEDFLCGLVYPLRNALLYLSAVQAAHRDPLTGVGNRAAFDLAIGREVEMARRHGTPLSLLILDIDRFKAINDTHGHLAGDDVIKAFTAVVDGVIRKTDILFRYGGEEFAVLLSNTARHGAELLAERIRRRIERSPFESSQDRVPVTASIGVANLEPTDSTTSLFEKTDQALYRAKHEGRNCVRVAPLSC